MAREVGKVKRISAELWPIGHVIDCWHCDKSWEIEPEDKYERTVMPLPNAETFKASVTMMCPWCNECNRNEVYL